MNKCRVKRNKKYCSICIDNSDAKPVGNLYFNGGYYIPLQVSKTKIVDGKPIIEGTEPSCNYE